MRIRRVATTVAVAVSVALSVPALCVGVASDTIHHGAKATPTVQAVSPLATQYLGFAPNTEACDVLDKSGAEQLVVQPWPSAYTEYPGRLGIGSLQGTTCDFGNAEMQYATILVFQVPNWGHPYTDALGEIVSAAGTGRSYSDARPLVTSFKINGDKGWLITPADQAHHGYTVAIFKVGNYAVELHFLTTQSYITMINLSDKIYAIVHAHNPLSKF